ncbi:MAG TPA: serine O-acetyltransferase [Alcaligenes faecalis]|nr:serine O-acetyltransferase [Alcaligenes faecalis]
MKRTKLNDLDEHVEPFILAALLECASREDYVRLMKTDVMETLATQVGDDLLAFTDKDPAAKSDPIFILKTYTSFSAVLHYRISHWIHKTNMAGGSSCVDDSLPGLLSRRGKMLSGAEIHFGSEIGERFVLDHGYGTVIGETSVIGDDCYVLGGVTLGARGIRGNPHASRHPLVGHRVQIGAFTSVLGRIQIGNDVFIGPNCIVTQDIPDGFKVKVKSSIQMISPECRKEN